MLQPVHYEAADFQNAFTSGWHIPLAAWVFALSLSEVSVYQNFKTISSIISWVVVINDHVGINDNFINKGF